MALQISGAQSYAGRYQYQNVERTDLWEEAYQKQAAEKKSLQAELGVDTVTFSDEGLAKSKNWRESTKAYSDIQLSGMNYEEQLKELNMQLHTVNMIDTASLFNCELAETASQIQSERSTSQENFMTVMAKAYQVIYDRIEEDFADPDRETTWILKDDGTYVEETKQDRIDALNKAYNRRAEFAASSARVMAQIEEHFHGKHYGAGFLDELEDKVKEMWENAVSEKNMERLRQKVNSVHEYSLDFGISGQWSDLINSLFYRK